ncbi:unnamed protein product [Phytomonas sp. Hart1]|nr:unnamed protein product [Phytomonas sp. Hart1]|eukprot:CCW66485.1 unnamed protein product [Phytomonas sp. isolate Hart1]
MKSETRLKRTVVSVIAYSACSVSMTILNKLIMNTYELNYPNSLLLMQNGGALLLIILAKKANIISYQNFKMSVAKLWLLPCIAFVAMLLSSMRSLEMMSVSAQTVIKNLAIILTAVGDSYIFGKRINTSMYGSFVLMIIGSCLCAKGDPWVTSWGLFWTFLNILTTVCYMLSIKLLTNKVGAQIGRYGPTLYSNTLSLPFFLLMGYSEFPQFMNAVWNASWKAIIFLVLMILVSAQMAFTVFFCMEMTSPTTFSVVGTLNKVPITFLGILIFHQFPEALGYLGISIALIGGFMYTLLNLNIRHVENKATELIIKSNDANGISSTKDLNHIV